MTELHTSALVASVREAWNRMMSPPMNNEVDNRMATIAVNEVVSALRANPAWCRSLGLGGAKG